MQECKSSADILNQQQAQTGSLATAINQMSVSISDIASNTNNAAKQSEAALESVVSGHKAVDDNMQNNYSLSEELSQTQKRY